MNGRGCFIQQTIIPLKIYDREYIRYYQGNTNNNLMIKYAKYRLLFQRIYEGDIAEK